MPKISINITNMLTFGEKTGWQRPRLMTDTVFGYDETSGCRAIAYRFVCPQFMGNAKKVLIAPPVRFPTNELTTQNFNISVTDTLPTTTDAYNTKVLGEDAGRVGTINTVLSGAGLVQELFEIPVSSLRPGSDYFIILSANEESTTTSYVNMVDCSMYYHPLPSTISIPPKAKHYLGDEIIIAINRRSSDAAHRITYTFGRLSGVVLDGYSEPNSVSWTPPLNLGAAIPNAMSGMCELMCETIIDDEVIGSSAITFMLHLPPTKCAPTISSIIVDPVNDNSTVSGWKTFVQGYSKIRATVSSSALYGASVVDCEVTFGSNEPLNGFSVTSDIIDVRGAVSVIATVTDSRGQRADASATVYVHPYSKPSLSNIVCHRTDDSGSYNMDGTRYFAQATSKYSSIAGKNSCVIEARVKAVGNEYGDVEFLTSGIGSVCGSGLSPYRNYVVQITVRDALNSTPYTIPIPEERNTFKIKDGGRGIGIGAIPVEDDLLNVGFNARFQGGVEIGTDGAPMLLFMVDGKPVGAVGSKTIRGQFGEMFIRVYGESGDYKEYTWVYE